MIRERLGEIRDELGSMQDDFMQYAFLVELSAYVDPHQPELMTEKNLQRGCQSQVWLQMHVEDGLFYMNATSDTLLIRGVLYIMMELFNGLPPKEIAQSQIDFLDDSGISKHFSASRRTGIRSITDAISTYCVQFLKTGETE